METRRYFLHDRTISEFLRRQLSWVLLAIFSLLMMGLLLWPLFYVDPRERLHESDGHFYTLRYIPGASEREGVIEFSLSENPHVIFQVKQIKPVDQMLFAAREKQGMYVQLILLAQDFDRIRGKPSSDVLVNPLGVRTPNGVYLVPGDAAAVGSFNRKAAAFAELILGGTLFGFLVPRLRSRWKKTGHQEGLSDALDPLWEWIFESPVRALLGITLGVVFASLLLLSVIPALALSGVWSVMSGLVFFRLKASGKLAIWNKEISDTRIRDVEAHVRKGFEKPSNRHVKAVEVLIQQAGGNINVHDASGRTPLWIASKAGSAEAVELLLVRGADPNISDTTEGITPLMLAAQAGALGMALKQLERKADALVQDSKKLRALDYARSASSKSAALIELLEKETRKAEIIQKQREEREKAKAEAEAASAEKKKNESSESTRS